MVGEESEELADLESTRRSLEQHVKVLKAELRDKKGKMSKFWYRLKAIIIHSGMVGFGHYFSFIKIKDKWFCFNDSHVSTKTEEEVLAQAKGQVRGYENCNCYCLFYERSNRESNSRKKRRAAGFLGAAARQHSRHRHRAAPAQKDLESQR